MPTFDLSVWDAYAVISAPAFVSALKSVVLPELGSPTMPTSSAMAASLAAPGLTPNPGTDAPGIELLVPKCYKIFSPGGCRALRLLGL
jgi:hypothetical protein